MMTEKLGELRFDGVDEFMFYVKNKNTNERKQVLAVRFVDGPGLGMTKFLFWNGTWVWEDAHNYVKD